MGYIEYLRARVGLRPILLAFASVVLFLCRLTGGRRGPDQDEVSEVAWLTAQELAALPEHELLTPLHQNILAQLDSGYFVL